MQVVMRLIQARHALIGVAALLVGLPWAWAAGAAPASAELQPEVLTTTRIPATLKSRIYVTDMVIAHLPDGRVRVFDASSGKYLGMVPSGYAGMFALSPARNEIYVATTHLSRTTRGERNDVFEIWDADTLSFQGEVLLPPRRAQPLNYRPLLQTSSDGRLAYVQNATPATSVTVVDIGARQVLGEIPTPGCWGIYPASTHPKRFSALCGDGTLTTLTLDNEGKALTRQTSGKLFDGDADAWFIHAERDGDRYWFLSFKGQLVRVNLGGEAPRVEAEVSIAAPKGWRPGGYQPFAVDAASGTAFVGMHPKGVEGSHKMPAAQIWKIDLNNGKKLAVYPGHGATSLLLSAHGRRLQMLDGERGTLNVWQTGTTLKPMVTVHGAGETAFQLESQD